MLLDDAEAAERVRSVAVDNFRGWCRSATTYLQSQGSATESDAAEAAYGDFATTWHPLAGILVVDCLYRGLFDSDAELHLLARSPYKLEIDDRMEQESSWDSVMRALKEGHPQAFKNNHPSNWKLVAEFNSAAEIIIAILDPARPGEFEFGAGEYAFQGRWFHLPSQELTLLQLLVNAERAIKVDDVQQKLWDDESSQQNGSGNTKPDPNKLARNLKDRLQKSLRSDFQLSNKEDPIILQQRSPGAWKLDKPLLMRASAKLLQA